MFARTQRLLLRPGWREDAPALHAAMADEGIVRNLASPPWPYALSDAEQFLARELDLPKSSIHGLCKTLTELGVLARVGPNQFAIGPHVLSWANAFQNQSSLAAEFQRLAAEDESSLKGEALNLSVLNGNAVMYVACRNGSNPLGLSFRIGMSLPAVFTATGKAMLSTYPAQEVEAIFGTTWNKPLTRTSVRSLSTLSGWASTML